MIVQGLLGMYLHHGSLGKKITFSYFLTVIVGIGRLVIKEPERKKTMRIIVIFKPNLFSTMFHATLLHEYQMWDEVS
jgi:hypothetical protein